METKYRIGYIDEDINQFKKYRRRFRKYGFEVIGYEFKKNMSLKDLMEQVYTSDIDLLMIDYKLKDTNKVTFNGEEVERELYEKKPLFPHIIFTNKVDQAEPFVEDWKIIFSKDKLFSEDEDNDDKEKVKKFMITLTKSIEQYRNYIQRKKDNLSSLMEKGKEQKLSPEEKHTLLKLQKELKFFDNTYKVEVPEYLMISKNQIESENLKTEAEEFLQKLIEKRKNQ